MHHSIKDSTRALSVALVMIVALTFSMSAAAQTQKLIPAGLDAKKILVSGNISKFAKKKIKTAKGKTVSLGQLTKAAFTEQDVLFSQLKKKGLVGKALLMQPKVRDNVAETKDAYVITKSVSFTVTDPNALKKSSPVYKSFLGKAGQKKIALSSLDKQEKAWLNKRIAEASKLPDGSPLKKFAKKGQQAFLNAMSEGMGELSVTDTLIIPKDFTPFSKGTVAPVITNGIIDYSKTKPFKSAVMKALNTPAKSSAKMDEETISKALAKIAKVTPPADHPIIKRSGEDSFVADFMAGETYSGGWFWEKKWKFYAGFFRVSAGGGFGFGIRIPIRVEGKIKPTSIIVYKDRDSAINTRGDIKVSVLDADKKFFKDVGISTNQIFDGKEIVLTYYSGLGCKLYLFGKDVVKIPFAGKYIDYSQNALFPLGKGNSSTGFHIPVPPEITNTTMDFNKYISGFVQFGLHVNGTGIVDLNLQELKNHKRGSKSTDLTFNNAGQKTFKIKLDARSSQGDDYYGFRLNNPQYKLDLTLIPEARIGVRVGYKKFHRSFTTKWVEFKIFAVHPGMITFRQHSGTPYSFTWDKGKKTFIKYNEQDNSKASKASSAQKKRRRTH